MTLPRACYYFYLSADCILHSKASLVFAAPLVLSCTLVIPIWQVPGTSPLSGDALRIDTGSQRKKRVDSDEQALDIRCHNTVFLSFLLGMGSVEHDPTTV